MEFYPFSQYVPTKLEFYFDDFIQQKGIATSVLTYKDAASPLATQTPTPESQGIQRRLFTTPNSFDAVTVSPSSLSLSLDQGYHGYDARQLPTNFATLKL